MPNPKLNTEKMSPRCIAEWSRGGCLGKGVREKGQEQLLVCVGGSGGGGQKRVEMFCVLTRGKAVPRCIHLSKCIKLIL